MDDDGAMYSPSTPRPFRFYRSSSPSSDEDDEQNDIDQAMGEQEHDEQNDIDQDMDQQEQYKKEEDDETDSSEIRGKRTRIDGVEQEQYKVEEDYGNDSRESRGKPISIVGIGQEHMEEDDDGSDSSETRENLRRTDGVEQEQYKEEDEDESDSSELSRGKQRRIHRNSLRRRSAPHAEWSDKKTRSVRQCRQRISNLKTRYNKEKEMMRQGAHSSSNWVYFEKIRSLKSCLPPPPPPASRKKQLQQHPLSRGRGGFTGGYVRARSPIYPNRMNVEDDDEDNDESDDLLPRSGEGGFHALFRMLADSIDRIGEQYEKISIMKMKHVTKLQKRRINFDRKLQMQKRQTVEGAKAKIANARQDNGDEVNKSEGSVGKDDKSNDCDDDDGIDDASS